MSSSTSSRGTPFSDSSDGAFMTPPDSDEKLDPAQERVLRKLRGFAAFSGLLMAFGFLALFGAIGYRVVSGWKSTPATIEGTIRLPKDARVLSASLSEGTIAVTIERQGAVETRFFDIKDHTPRGTIGYAAEP
ncbi:hypothetical protein MWN34_06185 [Ancylobacter sp. 6x-1]|uniref:MCE family protein n=1 Tax=Ancylobacter crimeensis TaxID=2579147 RepID=A0ABT0D965_9HYPH|nr:hypothetical protein [Ancylobacter crimeensis]MCK0196500.1 hypothetical protein [Ancylobacter crimeensis]